MNNQKVHIYIMDINDIRKSTFPANPLDQLKENRGKIRVIEGKLKSK